MTKTKGVPLPDPKKWKWCKHEGCDKYAIFLEDFCWGHLPDKAKSKYKAKIEKLVKEGRSLEGGNLFGVDLQEAYLYRANLQKAFLYKANLQEANLHGAKLQVAFLIGAKLQGANLSDAKVTGASLTRIFLDGALELTWKQVERVGEEKRKWWKDARDAYRRLKNYFHQQGRYQDESEAYYREKLMAKHEAYDQCFKQKQPKHFFTWFGLWLLWALAGFGERWVRTISWAVGTFVFFGLLYWGGSNIGWITLQSQVGDKIIQIKHLLNCLYFSLVTFVTLGFGDIWPAVTAWPAKILVGIEVVLGYVFLGMIVVLIARKFGR